MKKIVITSQNPTKIAATISGFQKMFPAMQFKAESISVPSNVSDQPLSSKETCAGALNRVNSALQLMPDADFWVGIEGGVMPEDDELVAFGWIVIRSKSGISKSRTGTFTLPPAIKRLIQEGDELGIAMDRVFATKDSKRNSGAIGLLTGEIIKRKDLYEHAVILALVPFRNEELYGS
jgi:inosine/xanthosine triphosphatase